MTRRLIRYGLTGVLLGIAPAASLAGEASDAVMFFYSEPTYEPDPALRDRFVDPAKSVFAASDKVAVNGDACIDWVLAIDAQDYDEATLASTLKLAESVKGDAAEVTATFTLFPDAQANSRREVLWTLREVGGAWKVADIASRTGGWTLSELTCQ
jgi:hypothetical protein